MSEVKYVTLDLANGGPSAFIFPPVLGHKEFAERIPHEGVLGAGFVSIGALGELSVHPYGRSVTLNIGPGPHDAKLLLRLLKGA